ncbi:DUF998 domain-containing protein [Shewanella sp. AS1]|uniref:DUF998 domain-containing protein n=1 Tax=Shewanella sp. AS1 TaxID=2907626 RepID=UPI001F3F8C83|nr:DUF998 domain-containing protein [Shewanella sp. AS1]MCE9679315.1 DUF998 domain-containing protein [Shewanella sp. AS1]
MTNEHPINYDFHRMVVIAILAGAFISALGISITFMAKFAQIGPLVFNQRPDYLGNYIDSPLAYIFNMGLIVAGLCILLAMYGLQQLRLAEIGKYIAMSGYLVGMFVILIGIYPINYLFEHRLFSTGFLIATLLLYVLTLCARLNHKQLCSRPLFVVSLLGFLAAASLTALLDWQTLDFYPCPHQSQRFCLVSFVMWCQTSLVVIWCITLAIGIKKLARQSYHDAITTKMSASYQ